jgi:hypothetical protein
VCTPSTFAPADVSQNFGFIKFDPSLLDSSLFDEVHIDSSKVKEVSYAMPA